MSSTSAASPPPATPPTTPTATGTRPRATSAYSALTRAGYQAYTRDRTTLFFTFAFPLLFLIVFGLIFHGMTVEESGRPYINYIAPGVLSWGVANAAVFGVGFVIMQWRRDDILRLIRMTPTPLPAVLGSRYVLALAVGAVQAAMFVLVAMLPFFGLEPAGSWPLVIPVLVLGITAFLAVGVIVGSFARTPEAVAAVANCLMVPMAFLSGSFFPLDAMPGWMQNVSLVLPLRYFNDGVSAAITGDGGSGEILVACGGIAAFAVVFCAIALKTFRWSDQS
ncbi:ABC transporter permease [Streptomyces sp. NBC_01498]|uniref:ABC transporter permease n=1 Tax=Streptomyces sp. NBC_01498 TaxID=2975870 RepID=UPI002E7B9FA4|nr:ABC transporter permease [Streptomyces sp. NBC_01498]WTL26478.1 ABC transporter permease [Streptomyces sp. NBC_01498]